MTFYSDRLARRVAVVLAVCALALGAGACSGGDDDDGSPGASGNGGGDNASGGEASGGGSGSEGSSATPEDSPLDVEVRSAEGVTMTLSSIAFDGDNILVDVEFLNGASEEVYVHDTTWDETQLRLVDDDGNVYNFLQPEAEDGPDFTLEQGETLSGTLEFVGPLVGETGSLRLVTNVHHEDVAALDEWAPGDQCDWCTSSSPGLVAAIPLEWG